MAADLWTSLQGALAAVAAFLGLSGAPADPGWLQGYGSFALMADLSELDRATFERDLDHRLAELRSALELHQEQARSQ